MCSPLRRALELLVCASELYQATGSLAFLVIDIGDSSRVV